MLAPRVIFSLLLIALLLGPTAFAQAALLDKNQDPQAEKKEGDAKPEKKSDEKQSDESDKKESDKKDSEEKESEKANSKKGKSDKKLSGEKRSDKKQDKQKDDQPKSKKDGDSEDSSDSADKKKARDKKSSEKKSSEKKSSDKKPKDGSPEKKRDEKKDDEQKRDEKKSDDAKPEMKPEEAQEKAKPEDAKADEKPKQETPKDNEKKPQGEPTPARKPKGDVSAEKMPAKLEPESKSALEKKPSSDSAQSETPNPKPERKPETQPEEKKIDRNKLAVTDLAQVDADFWLQGEYFGKIRRPDGVLETTGIQVVARGDGKFIGRQLRGGLPGNGWNNAQKIDLAGERSGNRLTLRHKAGFQVAIEDGKATVSNSSGHTLGVLAKVQRRSKMIGLQPTDGATVLFDGSETEHFVNAKIDENGLLQIGTVTKDPVQDFRLHIEFRLPYMPYATGQARANSGLYIQERYEVQILDSFGMPGEFNECGSLYRTKPPEVNMCFPPLVWQTYDVYFTAARFDEEGNKISPARISVLHNGILVQDNYKLPNKTGAGKPESPEARPIKLQDHGNPVVFRNIWIERPEEVVEPSRERAEQNLTDSIELQSAGEPLPRP